MVSKSLQPNKKSFKSYIEFGYRYSSSKELINNDLILQKINKIQRIDDSILILDDIKDKSKYRNGKKCLYIKIGKREAEKYATNLRFEAFNNLSGLCDLLGVDYKNKINAINKFKKFIEDVNKGEEIDILLKKNIFSETETMKKYFEMISLFTGGHMKYGFEIGCLLANKNINPKISKILISLGRIRQILDDYNDYFKNHHEPFGDFINNKNRLPEILFKKFGGNKKEALFLLKYKKYKKARNLILNQKVREKLFSFCQKEHIDIQNIDTSFNYLELVEDYSIILNK